MVTKGFSPQWRVAKIKNNKYGLKKLPTDVRSKIKSQLNSKIVNFISDFHGGQQLKIMMVTKRSLLGV